ncbi:NAD(P)/FAD-dependent oxidoreductase [Jhaorihella thermophila]|uniref:Glycine/D-amino acid oxidase n=1 Tax=Jhaorihella thermophila TaxID=488547 RepID=A0A1H5YXC5_9RHOB|nr:FAD-binding oxidoreductase [Jhaorihella thermophila]SEG28452.1 Glycine/D-amino acid oxidase [Jhaorihella thermophila]
MRRIFPAYAYGDGPRRGCWWDETVPAPDWPVAAGDISVDVAVVGGGFTGVSAALHLAEAGASVALFEAMKPGWGASGRNGGFCCVGGAKISDAALISRYGAAEKDAFRGAEVEAVNLVARLLERHRIDADTHSRGETQLAHNRRAYARMVAQAEADEGVLTPPDQLAAQGFGGPFHGAITYPVGFGLNPRKYLFGLARAAEEAGARLYQQSPVERLERGASGWRLRAGAASVRADAVLIATNGYSSEDMPGWLAGRYMPAQSTVMVTRPLTRSELDAQGWATDQMAFDSRNLLHYFRLMPDRRFLFGMRGGLISGPRAEPRIRRRLRRHFDAMFPAWRGVEADHMWSGMVCLAWNRTPFVGPVPDRPGLFAGLAYHGNGVAMGSYSGRLLADLALGRWPDLPWPAPMRDPMARFPLGRARRALMWPVYGLLALADL